jgi:hypothetical protein
MDSTPNRYPASEENTTLKDSRILVISLKSEITEGVANEDFELLNVYILNSFCFASAKILY